VSRTVVQQSAEALTVAPYFQHPYGLSLGDAMAAKGRPIKRITTMRRVIVTVACGLLLAGCSSMPSMDFLPSLSGGGANIPARFESEPQGAEVRTSNGQTCRTPCALALPAADFTATFSMAGYQPQTVPVQIRSPEVRNEAEFAGSAEFFPNPVVAGLEPAPPPPKRRAAPPKKPKPAAAARAPARAAPARAAAPPPAAEPAPAAAAPWPATR
jgi:hypothetical protein